MKFAVLLSNNNRSKAYIQNLVQRGFVPSQAIVLLSDSGLRPENTKSDLAPAGAETKRQLTGLRQVDVFFDEREHVLDTLANMSVDNVALNTLEVNSESVVSAVKDIDTDYIVYSGPGGTILRSAILGQNKEFIHVHPGWLPEYRGSTTMYYSLLVDRTVSCSVILMREGIDSGPVLLQKKFRLDEPDLDYDYVVDPCLRTATLVEFFSNRQECLASSIHQDAGQANTFYIIHPVLKHLSIMQAKGSD